MTRMGAHGEGGIGKRRADGRLPVSIVINGQRVYRMIPAMADRREQYRLAREAQRELIALRRADINPSGQTLAEWLRSWIRALPDGRRTVAPRTIEFYAMIVERHIIPTLGRIRLDRLNERDVQRWLDAEPGSPRSIHHYRAVLRRSLNIAAKQRIIPHNPVLAAEIDEPDDFEGNPLTIDETRALLAVPDRLSALWRLAIVTGLRQGELLGLGWDDIDLDGGNITVTAQLQRLGGSWARVAPKAGRELGRLAIDPGTVASLQAHRVQQAAERRPDWAYWGHVFLTPKGRPIGRSECLRQFHAACDAAGIERRRFHDLRGSSATLLRDLGVDKETRKARLGHATDDMAAHYAKASEAQDREAVRKLSEAIG